MNRKVTIEIIDSTVLQLLRSLASLSLIRFTPDTDSQNDHITTRLNEIYKNLDSSLDPCIMAAQVEILDKEDW